MVVLMEKLEMALLGLIATASVLTAYFSYQTYNSLTIRAPAAIT